MKIAILGHGTIGKGVFEIAKNNPDFEVKKVLELKNRWNPAYPNIFTDNIQDILNDEEIEIVVEVMGGFDFAYSCIKQCLEHHKNVATANKEVVALKIDELTSLAQKNNVKFLYEASVGGGIPIIKQITEIRRTSEIKGIYGILNGTTNYILTKELQGMSFESALKEAQEKGFAEKDPTADLEGLDMMRKIAILSDLAWNTKIKLEDITHQGITLAQPEDIQFAKENDETIKFICSAVKENNQITIGIRPYYIENTNFFATVNNEFNAVMLDTTYNDKLTFIGKGAGSLPTAAAIFGDLYAIKNNYVFDTYQSENEYKVQGIQLSNKLQKM